MDAAATNTGKQLEVLSETVSAIRLVLKPGETVGHRARVYDSRNLIHVVWLGYDAYAQANMVENLWRRLSYSQRADLGRDLVAYYKRTPTNSDAQKRFPMTVAETLLSLVTIPHKYLYERFRWFAADFADRQFKRIGRLFTEDDRRATEAWKKAVIRHPHLATSAAERSASTYDPSQGVEVDWETFRHTG